MPDDKKINWTAIAVAVPLLISLVGWGIAVESRLASNSAGIDLSERVSTLENLLTPLVVEYQVAERLREMGIDVNGIDRLDTPAPTPLAIPTNEPLPDVGELRKEAEDWTRSQMQKGF